MRPLWIEGVDFSEHLYPISESHRTPQSVQDNGWPAGDNFHMQVYKAWLSAVGHRRSGLGNDGIELEPAGPAD